MERKTHTIFIGLLLIGIIALSFSVSKAEEVKTFEVKADDYKFIPDTITVNQGDRVVIKALAVDKDHGFYIKQYKIDQLMPKGQWVSIEFVADRAGEFTIRCSKFCGWKHFWMTGKLIVK